MRVGLVCPYSFDVPGGVQNHVQDLAETPWAREREVFAEVEPGARVTAAPFRSEGATIGVQGPAPRFGEHTRAVLAERCGLTAAELDRLEADGIIKSG